jgi:D-xylose 1-dehydrogenase (NADP+, D-xylono-1,5-lactone-forming)
VSEAVRWGILGTAHINRRLVPAMRAARRSLVAAVASRDAQRGDAYAREWNIAVAYHGYDTLLRDSGLDAVYIPLPNSLHVEWTLRALDAGKHVLCEKPLALSGEEVDRVAAVAKARERVVAEAFMYRHEPLFARVLSLVRDDAIGAIRTINTGFTFVQNRQHDIRLDRRLGGGSLWDIGCYPVSAALAIAGTTPLDAFGWALAAPSGVDESCTALLRFPGPLVATIHCGFRAAYRTWLDVAGTDGAIHVSSPFKPGLRETIDVQRGDRSEIIAVEGSPLLFVRQIDDFVAAVLDGRAPAMSLQESRGVASTLAAVHRSVERQGPVQL